MNTIDTITHDFLQQKHIAVVGVSAAKSTPANGVYERLKKLHYNVFAVNPHIEKFKDDACYPDLKSIPSSIDGVFIVTRPDISEKIVEQCVELKIPRVWMHCSMGLKYNPSTQTETSKTTSVSLKAIRLCRENNITVIPGACPMMFCEPVDWFHKFLRWILGIAGKLKIQ